MEVLLCSDSHGDLGTLLQVVEENPFVQHLLFLGDGAEEFAQLKKLYPRWEMKNVTGNCDWPSAQPERELSLAGYRIFMTHGHTYQVKSGLERLFVQGQSRRADIVLYGHTHQAEITWRDKRLYFCPGSISQSPHGRPSYGKLLLEEEAITPTIHWL